MMTCNKIFYKLVGSDTMPVINPMGNISNSKDLTVVIDTVETKIAFVVMMTNGNIHAIRDFETTHSMPIINNNFTTTPSVNNTALYDPDNLFKNIPNGSVTPKYLMKLSMSELGSLLDLSFDNRISYLEIFNNEPEHILRQNNLL